MGAIRVIDVWVYYGGYRALGGVSLEIAPGDVVAVLGPNGSGKTTLLKTIDGILRPARGSVYIDGRDLHSYVQRELAKILAYVPQRIEVSTHMTVLDFVLTGRRPYANFGYSRVDIERAVDALRSTNAEHLIYRSLNQLSGGELQRVVIARALVSEPRVLLLDEPTASLDPRYQIEVLTMVKRLSREKGIAVLMALHDLTHAYRYSDKVLMLRGGEMVAAGPPDEILTPENIERVFDVKVMVLRDLKAVIVGYTAV